MVSFQTNESGEDSFTLTAKQPRHLSTSNYIEFSTTSKVTTFTAAQYSGVNIYALDFSNAQRFLNGQSFTGYSLTGSGNEFGLGYVTLPAGRYYIGANYNGVISGSQTISGFNELDVITLSSDAVQIGNVPLGVSGNAGAYAQRRFNVTGSPELFIETEGSGGKFMIMSDAQWNAFSSAYPNGFTSGSYNFVDPFGYGNGAAATEIETQFQLPDGNWNLVWINDSGRWAGGAANIIGATSGNAAVLGAVANPPPPPKPAYSLAASLATINEGDSDPILVATANVTPGTTLAYSISGIAANRLKSGSLSGAVVIDSVGRATIDFGVIANKQTDGKTTATITLGSNLASTSVTINDTSVNPLTIINSSISTSSNSYSGGAGATSVHYAQNITNYTVTKTGFGYLVQDKFGAHKSDTLTNIQYLHFANTGEITPAVAVGATGGGGVVAQGAADIASAIALQLSVVYFGRPVGSAILNSLAGLSGGAQPSNAALATINTMAIQDGAFAATDTSSKIVTNTFKNIMGFLPSAFEQQAWGQYIDNGVLTKGAAPWVIFQSYLGANNVPAAYQQPTQARFVAAQTFSSYAVSNASDSALSTYNTAYASAGRAWLSPVDSISHAANKLQTLLNDINLVTLSGIAPADTYHG